MAAPMDRRVPWAVCAAYGDCNPGYWRGIAPCRRGDTARGDRIGRPGGWGRVVVRDSPIRTAGGRSAIQSGGTSSVVELTGGRPCIRSHPWSRNVRAATVYLRRTTGMVSTEGDIGTDPTEVEGPDLCRAQAFGSKRCSGISTRTADPVAVTVPLTESSVSTTTLRPLISTSRPMRWNSERGVGSR